MGKVEMVPVFSTKHSGHTKLVILIFDGDQNNHTLYSSRDG